MTQPGELHVVLPGGVEDASSPSGGNTYDLNVCAGLTDAGWSVRRISVPGSWPRPRAGDLDALAGALATVPDGSVVLLDGLVACAAPEVVVPQAHRLRLVALVHLPLADETGQAPDDAADLDARERRTLHAACAVVATSVAAGRRLVEHHGLPAAGVHVAAPGVDPAPPAPGTDGGTQLLCVAAVTPRKGQDVLVEALAAVADLPWSCLFVGALHRDLGYVERVREAARAHGLDARVQLVGPRTGDDLAATYAAADLLLLASHAEPFGMVVTEALAGGIPVLATGVGGVPEAFGHTPDGRRPGILVGPGDPTAFAAALRRWLTEPGLRSRLRAAARVRRAALPGWDVTTAQLASVLADAGRPPR
jgi:glycosyltransferase involved in cell wall biosynthesis